MSSDSEGQGCSDEKGRRSKSRSSDRSSPWPQQQHQRMEQYPGPKSTHGWPGTPPAPQVRYPHHEVGEPHKPPEYTTHQPVHRPRGQPSHLQQIPPDSSAGQGYFLGYQFHRPRGQTSHLQQIPPDSSAGQGYFPRYMFGYPGYPHGQFGPPPPQFGYDTPGGPQFGYGPRGSGPQGHGHGTHGGAYGPPYGVSPHFGHGAPPKQFGYETKESNTNRQQTKPEHSEPRPGSKNPTPPKQMPVRKEVDKGKRKSDVKSPETPTGKKAENKPDPKAEQKRPSASKPKEPEKMYVCVSGISEDVSNETVINYLEVRSKLDIVMDESLRTEDDLEHAIIVFSDQIDLKVLKNACDAKKLKNCRLTFDDLDPPRQLIFSSEDNKLTESSLKRYLPGKHLETVRLHETDDGSISVKMKNAKGVTEILKSTNIKIDHSNVVISVMYNCDHGTFWDHSKHRVAIPAPYQPTVLDRHVKSFIIDITSTCNERLEKHHARLSVTDEICIECTLDPKDKQARQKVKTWKDNVEKAWDEFVTGNAHKKDLKITHDVKDLMVEHINTTKDKHTSEELKVIHDEDSLTIIFVGKSKIVENFHDQMSTKKGEIQEHLKRQNRIKTEPMKVKPIEIALMYKENKFDQLDEIAPDFKYDVDQENGKITFTGVEEDISKAKVNIFEIKNNFHSWTIKNLSPGRCKLLANEQVSGKVYKKLSDDNIPIVFEIGQGQVMVCITNHDDSKSVDDVFKEIVLEDEIQLDDTSKNVLVSEEWAEKKTNLKNLFRDIADIDDSADDKIIVIATSDVFEEIMEYLEQFIRDHSIYEETVKINDEAEFKYLKMHCKNMVKELEFKNSDKRLKTRFVNQAVEISGTKKAITSACSEVNSQIGKIKIDQYLITKLGMYSLFKDKNKCADIIGPIEEESRSVIASLTKSSFRRKTGRQETDEDYVKSQASQKYKRRGESRLGKSTLVNSSTLFLTDLYPERQIHSAAEKPSKPQGPLEVSDITEDHVKLSWKPPMKDGGSNITAYIVEKSEAQRPRWLRVARLLPDTMTADVDNLIENKYFRVMAENEAGIDPALESDKAVAPKSKYGPPGKPKGPLKVKPLTKDSVTLDWKLPETDDGSPITSYSVEKKEGTRHTWFQVASTRGSVTDYTVSGLTEGRDYAFRVYAENRYGRSQPLESDLMVAPKKVQELPSPPTSLRVKDVTKDSLTLAWEAPESGQKGLTGYMIEKRTPDSDHWERVARVPALVKSHHISSLPEGATFHFRVFAENSAGLSGPSELKKPVELKGKKERPGAISNAPEITALGPKFVELSWQPPEHGGSPIIGYILEHPDVGGRSWMPVNKAPISDTKYRISNLYDEIPYRIRVKAVNDEGVSEPSPETEQFYCREQKAMEAPKFSKLIEDLSAVEGREARFTSEVTGLPVPNVTWYRNYREVFSGRHYTIKSENGVHTLIIKDIEEGGDSKIECIAKNRMGSATSKARMDVLVPPKIIEIDRLSDICKGDLIRFQYRGKPEPQVIWSVEGETIEGKHRVDIKVTPKHSVLTINDSERPNSGSYKISVKNKLGSDSISIPIRVIEEIYKDHEDTITKMSEQSEENWTKRTKNIHCNIFFSIFIFFRPPPSHIELLPGCRMNVLQSPSKEKIIKLIKHCKPDLKKDVDNIIENISRDQEECCSSKHLVTKRGLSVPIPDESEMGENKSCRMDTFEVNDDLLFMNVGRKRDNREQIVLGGTVKWTGKDVSPEADTPHRRPLYSESKVWIEMDRCEENADIVEGLDSVKIRSKENGVLIKEEENKDNFVANCIPWENEVEIHVPLDKEDEVIYLRKDDFDHVVDHKKKCDLNLENSQIQQTECNWKKSQFDVELSEINGSDIYGRSFQRETDDNICHSKSDDKICHSESVDKICHSESVDKISHGESDDRVWHVDRTSHNESGYKILQSETDDKICSSESTDKVCHSESDDKVCHIESDDTIWHIGSDDTICHREPDETIRHSGSDEEVCHIKLNYNELDNNNRKNESQIYQYRHDPADLRRCRRTATVSSSIHIRILMIFMLLPSFALSCYTSKENDTECSRQIATSHAVNEMINYQNKISGRLMTRLELYNETFSGFVHRYTNTDRCCGLVYYRKAIPVVVKPYQQLVIGFIETNQWHQTSKPPSFALSIYLSRANVRVKDIVCIKQFALSCAVNEMISYHKASSTNLMPSYGMKTLLFELGIKHWMADAYYGLEISDYSELVLYRIIYDEIVDMVYESWRNSEYIEFVFNGRDDEIEVEHGIYFHEQFALSCAVNEMISYHKANSTNLMPSYGMKTLLFELGIKHWMADAYYGLEISDYSELVLYRIISDEIVDMVYESWRNSEYIEFVFNGRDDEIEVEHGIYFHEQFALSCAVNEMISYHKANSTNLMPSYGMKTLLFELGIKHWMADAYYGLEISDYSELVLYRIIYDEIVDVVYESWRNSEYIEFVFNGRDDEIEVEHGIYFHEERMFNQQFLITTVKKRTSFFNNYTSMTNKSLICFTQLDDSLCLVFYYPKVENWKVYQHWVSGFYTEKTHWYQNSKIEIDSGKPRFPEATVYITLAPDLKNKVMLDLSQLKTYSKNVPSLKKKRTKEETSDSNTYMNTLYVIIVSFEIYMTFLYMKVLLFEPWIVSMRLTCIVLWSSVYTALLVLEVKEKCQQLYHMEWKSFTRITNCLMNKRSQLCSLIHIVRRVVHTTWRFLLSTGKCFAGFVKNSLFFATKTLLSKATSTDYTLLLIRIKYVAMIFVKTFKWLFKILNRMIEAVNKDFQLNVQPLSDLGECKTLQSSFISSHKQDTCDAGYSEYENYYRLCYACGKKDYEETYCTEDKGVQVNLINEKLNSTGSLSSFQDHILDTELPSTMIVCESTSNEESKLMISGKVNDVEYDSVKDEEKNQFYKKEKIFLRDLSLSSSITKEHDMQLNNDIHAETSVKSMYVDSESTCLNDSSYVEVNLPNSIELSIEEFNNSENRLSFGKTKNGLEVQMCTERAENESIHTLRNLEMEDHTEQTIDMESLHEDDCMTGFNSRVWSPPRYNEFCLDNDNVLCTSIKDGKRYGSSLDSVSCQSSHGLKDGNSSSSSLHSGNCHSFDTDTQVYNCQIDLQNQSRLQGMISYHKDDDIHVPSSSSIDLQKWQESKSQPIKKKTELIVNDNEKKVLNRGEEIAELVKSTIKNLVGEEISEIAKKLKTKKKCKCIRGGCKKTAGKRISRRRLRSILYPLGNICNVKTDIECRPHLNAPQPNSSLNRPAAEPNQAPAVALPRPVLATSLPSTTNSLNTYFSKMMTGHDFSTEEKMQYEMLRVHSFQDLPASCKASPLRLARTGFFSSGISDEVTCFSCGVRYKGWQMNDNPSEIHRRISPDCRMVNNTETRNVPAIPHSNGIIESSAQQESLANNNFVQTTIHADGALSTPVEQNRALTRHEIQNANVADTTPQARNGVQQPYVNQQYNRQTAIDRSNSVLEGEQIQSGRRDTAEDLGITLDRPKYPAYAQLNVRISTFQGWPGYLDQTPRDMALAGFFYAGYNDYCRCFFCGGGLRNWDAGDDPWVEHARWFSKCAFVRQNRGNRFVEIIVKRQAELEAAGNTSGSASSHTSVTHSETESRNQTMPQPGTQSGANTSYTSDPAVESVRDMGYSNDLIQRAISIIRQNNSGKERIEATEILEVIFTIADDDNSERNAAVPSDNTPISTLNQPSQQVSEPNVSNLPVSTQSSAPSQGPGIATSQGQGIATSQSGNASESSLPSLSVSSLELGNAGAKSEQSGAGREISENDIRSLQEENIQLKEQVMCKICMDKNVSIAFLPCGHLACCIDCAPAMRKCPMCRVYIKGTVKTYLA